MCKILVFAGTTEGYQIVEYLASHKISVHMCVATEYGSTRIKGGEYVTTSYHRLDESQMRDFMRENSFNLVVDATHPYATEVTGNISRASKAAGLEYLRVVRDAEQPSYEEGHVFVDTMEDAVQWLEGREGKVLVTTGSKELKKFTALTDYQNRVYARVLSLPGVVEECSRLGFQGTHLICMQGPFSKELNTAMLRQYNCTYMVTKESGSNGGFSEKCQAAREAGAVLVVIGRPMKEEGVSLQQCKAKLQELCGFLSQQKITLVGVGMGTGSTLTAEAAKACSQAQLIIGGERLVKGVASCGQAVYYEYQADKIYNYIQGHPEYENIVIALSGDVGFYSGARKLLDILGDHTEVISGISSLNYFMGKIHQSWEDAAIVSAHGKESNVIHHIKTNRKTFAILGKKDGIAVLSKKLLDYGLEDVILYVGERLSYEDEKIFHGKPEELTEYMGDSLTVVCAVNPGNREVSGHLKDEDFLRGKVPMTKEEIRHLSVDKLELTSQSICWDIGAGTGSVSMEMALQAWNGRVYAIEKKDEAVELIERNRRHFGIDNLKVIPGLAPEALENLEMPTHAFVGGSSGNLKEILKVLLHKNPQVKIVINCIALETVGEVMACIKCLPLEQVDITQAAVSKSKQMGAYHMMMGENPIYIISCKGGAKS